MSRRIQHARVGYGLMLAWGVQSIFVGCGGPGRVGALTPPESVPSPQVDALPERVNKTPLRVSGSRASGLQVWLHADSAADAVLAAEAGEQTAWETQLQLVEGANRFVVYAVQGTSNAASPPVGPFTVELDTLAPPPPTFGQLPATTPDATVELMGGRAEEASLCIRIDQSATCATTLDADGTEIFSYTADLVLGDNTFCISASDDLGNESEETCATIRRLVGREVTIVRPADGGLVNGESFNVVVAVGAAQGAADPVAEVEVCVDGANCAAAQYSVELDAYTVEHSAQGFAEGSEHSLRATVTSVGGVASSADSSFIYTVGDALLLSDNAMGAHSRDVAVVSDDSGALHVAWMDNCAQYDGCDIVGEPQGAGGEVVATLPGDIFYRQWSNGQWGPIRLISSVPGDAHSSSPSLAVDGSGNVHFAWSDTGTVAPGDDDEAADIVTRILFAQTGTLSPAQVVGHSADVDGSPRLSSRSDQGFVHLVWEKIPESDNNDRDIYYSRWQAGDGGTDAGSWSEPTRISTYGSVDGISAAPALAVDASGAAWIAWQEQSDLDMAKVANPAALGGAAPHILLRKRSADGTLGDPWLISDNGLDGVSRSPAIAVDQQDKVHVVWMDDGNIQGSGVDPDVWYRMLEPTGGGLGAYHLMSPTEASVDGPEVAVGADGAIFIAWYERIAGGDTDILMRVRRNHLTGAPPLVVSTDSTGAARSPALALSADGNVHIAWHDRTKVGVDDVDRPHGGGDDYDIMYRFYAADSVD